MADDIFHLNEGNGSPWGTASPQQPSPGVPSQKPAAPSPGGVSAPPADITIRTMRSDIESLSRTGGNRPQAQKVALPLNMAQVPGGGGSSAAITVVLILIGLAVVGLLGYFVVRPFLASSPAAKTSSSPASTQPSSAQPAIPQEQTSSPAPRVQNVEHVSFFRQPSPRMLNLTLQSSVQNAADLQTYSQRLSTVTSVLKPSELFAEVVVSRPDGTHPSLSEFLYSIQAPILSEQFLSDNFNPDFTMLVHNGGGIWPVYVLKFREGRNWLFLRDDIGRLETSPSLDSVFATSPGNRLGTFQDGFVGEQQVRTLKYSNQTAALVYGRLREYIIIATSREGFHEAAGRL